MSADVKASVVTTVERQFGFLSHYLGVHPLFRTPYRLEPKMRYNQSDLTEPYQLRVLLPFSALVRQLGFPWQYCQDFPSEHFPALYYSVLMRLWAALVNRLNDLRFESKINLSRVVNCVEYHGSGHQAKDVQPIEQWWERRQRVITDDHPCILPVTLDGFIGQSASTMRQAAASDPALLYLTTVDGLIVWLGMSEEELIYWIGGKNNRLYELYFPGDKHNHYLWGVWDCPFLLFTDRVELSHRNSNHSEGGTGQLVARTSIES